MPLIAVNNKVERLFSLISLQGNTHYGGENITLLQHMCQTAMLAEMESDDGELILAAFLHDVGHLEQSQSERHTNGNWLQHHETIGAQMLAGYGFSERVVALVANHVLAKRYLVYKYPDYYFNLTDAGREALDFQGGPLCMEEAFQFENHPLFEQVICLRMLDERAKQRDVATPSVQYYKEKALYHLVSLSNGVRPK
jgi:2-amino-1-hydroxyethylphosphonate dioxygenase (glycine-forming)